MKSPKVVLITGASSGIGKACADFLHAQGHTVYGASRRSTPSAPYRTLTMDVTDDEQVRCGVATVAQEVGAVDVLVNCAGAGIAGAVEDTSVPEAREQLEVNFFGPVRVCLAVLPSMRAKRAGLIVNISSLMGLVGLPFQSYYCASKFALEGWSQALRIEVAPFGVAVVLIEPGDFRTGFTGARRRVDGSAAGSPYRERCEVALQTMERSERTAPDPIKVAKLLGRIIRQPAPRLRYMVGPTFQQLGVAARHLVPSNWFEWGLQKACGL